MATDLFTCCDRLDESKYWHLCSCPSATPVCESEQITPELCGFSEFEGDGIVASVPPKKYLVRTYTVYGQQYYRWYCCDGTPEIGRDGHTTSPEIETATYDPSDCSVSTTFDAGNLNESLIICGQFQWEQDRAVGNVCGGYAGTTTTTTVSTTLVSLECSDTSEFFSGSPCAGETEVSLIGYEDRTLTSEDTDQDAIDRATPVSGTSCSSRWETRNTQFSWVKRTSGYTIECDDLVIGAEYEVTPLIRKRLVTDDWEDPNWTPVTVTPVSFTATAKTETIDDGGDPIALDHIQGWEYEITGVNIEKKA